MQNISGNNNDFQTYIIDQEWDNYSKNEHQIWVKLFDRQAEILKNRACNEFLDGLNHLDLRGNGIPNFEILNKKLYELTKWKIVAVEGLVPDKIFFDMLANRIFPAGRFIRKPEEFDYIEEPDIFHDVFGHVPLLTNQTFADYMQAYGKGGQRAFGLFSLKELARLYWYTVEFGLMNTNEGLRIYGAGIVSSPAESIFCLEDKSPNRIGFDLIRLMRTNYRIDDFQETYFVIESFAQLFDATQQDFKHIYEKLETLSALETNQILPQDLILNRGTHAYHDKKV